MALLNFFVNTGPYGPYGPDHMELKMSKRYSSYNLHLMSAKLYEYIGYHGGLQGITCLGNRPSFKNVVGL